MYTIGGVAALPFVGPAIDTWGRRWGMFIGAVCVVIGAVIMSTSAFNGHLGQFMGGRFFCGFGVTIAASAGPVYVIEVSHPAYRGILGAFYNTWWFTGSILATGVTRGTNTIVGRNSWLVSIWVQVFFPGLICLFFWVLPESPRWLYTRGRTEEAKAMLARFHGEGNPNSIWVTLQLNEYEEFLNMNGADKRWWDYRALFKTRSTSYRIFCNCCVQAFGQLAGNSVLSYFQAAAFTTAGFTGQAQQNNLSLGNACQQFFFALCGATLVDKVGRRPLLLFSNIGCCITWLCMTIAAGIFAQSKGPNGDLPGNKSAGDATLAFQFVFGAVYSIGFTPLQALYPVEVLSFEMRAKGMAFGGLFMNVVSLFNNYVWPICLQAIGWKTYIVFTVWCAIQAGVIWWAIPETKNRTVSLIILRTGVRMVELTS